MFQLKDNITLVSQHCHNSCQLRRTGNIAHDKKSLSKVTIDDVTGRWKLILNTHVCMLMVCWVQWDVVFSNLKMDRTVCKAGGDGDEMRWLYLMCD